METKEYMIEYLFTNVHGRCGVLRAAAVRRTIAVAMDISPERAA
jgi:hypothetical protein